MPLESTREHLEGQQPAASGIGRDIERLKTGTAATTEELREFLGALKGRSPEEVMGVVAQSNLVGSTILAFFGTVLVFFVCTAIPYGLAKMSPEEVAKEAPQSASDKTRPSRGFQSRRPCAGTPPQRKDCPPIDETGGR